MKLKFCFLLLVSPALGALCNLENCKNFTSSDLKGHGVELGGINLTTDVIVLTGQAQENCSVWLVCSSNFYNSYETKLFINVTTEQFDLHVTHTVNYALKDILQIFVDYDMAGAQNDPGRLFNAIKLLFEDQKFAQYFSDQYNSGILINYEDGVDPQKMRLLRGEKQLINFKTETITRKLRGNGCSDDFTVSFCPCSEPVITELVWKEDENTLHCTVASIEGRDNIFISWTENDTSVQNNITEHSSAGQLTKTSILHNVTSLEMSRDITCTVSMQANKSEASTRTITVPAHSEEPDGEASEGQDENDSNSQAFLTILIIILVVSVVAVAVFCFGAVKLVQRYKDKRAQEPQRLDAVEHTAGNSVDDGQIIQPYAENGGSGTQIESNYHDLEELLDAVEPRVVRTDEVPLYTQVNIKKPVEQENIYNRLDPKLMTVNRGDPDRWRTLRSGEASPHTLGASPHTLGASPLTRMVEQPPVGPALPGILARANNFCPASEEGHYEMQTLKL